MERTQRIKKKEVEELYRVQEGKFRKKEGHDEEKKRRIQEVEDLQRIERMDGKTAKEVYLFNVLKGRAEINNNKTSDGSGIVPEMLKSLSFKACRSIKRRFDDMHTGRKKEHPEC